AIIIGESVYTQIRADGHTVDNVIIGAKRVAVAATFGVLTTMAAFAPMLFIGTIFAPFFITMSTVVILCLIFSLIESKLILPAHLAHARIPPVDEKTLFDPNQKVSLLGRIPRFFKRFQRRVQHGLQKLIHGAYVPLLQRALDNRGVTASLFLATLILTIGLLASGNVRTVLLPDVPSDFIQVNVEMQNGTAPEVRNAALNRIETAAMDVSAEYVAANPGAAPPVFHIGTFTRSDNEGVLFVEMPLDDNRALQGEDVVELWRDKLGEIPGMKTLDFTDANNIGGGAPLSFKLVGQNYPALESAAKELEARLAEYNGVFDIRNSISAGGEEIRLSIKPAAEALGLTMSSLGRQVRQAFYGEEAQRIQRGKDEVRVMVRYPMEQR
ncbi:MAG: efflux RND transporter permease subunit, partial [Pseudomonadota bacterium]